jgi:hydrogenase/urease accessory protein HupE
MLWISSQTAKAKGLPQQKQMEQHMTKMISLSALVLAGTASSAFAHGDHSGDVLQVLAHLLTEPDHLAMLSVAVVVGFGLYRLARHKA